MGTIEQMEGSCAPVHLTGLSLRPKMFMTLVRIDLIKNSKSKVVTPLYLLIFPVWLIVAKETDKESNYIVSQPVNRLSPSP